MNAIELLKEDQDMVDKLLQSVKANEGGDHWQAFEEIRAELLIHTHIEEGVSPRLVEWGDQELAGITREEHHGVEVFLHEVSEPAETSQVFEPATLLVFSIPAESPIGGVA